MKKTHVFIATLTALCGNFYGCTAQAPFGTHLLQLNKTILLPEVKSRIDHLDINLKSGIVYMAALGNNTVEVVDLATGKLIHSIKGLDEPQCVGYVKSV